MHTAALLLALAAFSAAGAVAGMARARRPFRAWAAATRLSRYGSPFLAWARLYSSRPDADPVVEAHRRAARRWHAGFAACAAACLGLTLAAASLI